MGESNKARTSYVEHVTDRSQILAENGGTSLREIQNRKKYAVVPITLARLSLHLLLEFGVCKGKSRVAETFLGGCPGNTKQRCTRTGSGPIIEL